MALIRKSAFAVAIFWLAHVPAPASAASAPSTRLVRCDPGNCLLISGQRDNGTSEVRINGHMVAVEGNRKWRVRLPVATVRDWSSPLARTIDISFFNLGTAGASETADLPIGFLGHTKLASLVVGVN